MSSRTLTVNGQTIAIRESSGAGRAAILVHGNSSSGRTFEHQLESSLGQTYRLVALDLPGHGDSEPAHDPQVVYSLPGYAAIVRGVAEQLGLTDAVFVGWSLGGHIVLEASAGLPQAAGFAIYGTPPLAFPPDMAAAFRPHPAMAASFAAELTEEQMDAYVTAFFMPGVSALPAGFREDIRRTDGRARAGLGASIRPDGYLDEVQIVAALKKPLAILHGEHEQLVSLPYLQGVAAPTLWRGAVQLIADSGHAPHWEQPAAFNALLEAFIKDCSV
ncbi:MAG TPA: alpha/beta hydrolase [Anaerolineales bacterium]|nr:alpha/beta hydrolase [Anaerolineales bacterium]